MGPSSVSSLNHRHAHPCPKGTYGFLGLKRRRAIPAEATARHFALPFDALDERVARLRDRQVGGRPLNNLVRTMDESPDLQLPVPDRLPIFLMRAKAQIPVSHGP